MTTREPPTDAGQCRGLVTGDTRRRPARTPRQPVRAPRRPNAQAVWSTWLPLLTWPPDGEGDPLATPTSSTDTKTKPQRRWRVILFNDEVHTFDEVIFQLQKAIGCSLEVAEATANEVDSQGSAVCFFGDRLKCDIVAGILRQIDLQVDVDVDA